MMELRAEKISQDFLRYSAKDGYFIAVQETDLRLAAGTLTVVTGRSGSACSWMVWISMRWGRTHVPVCAAAASASCRSV